MIRKCTMNDLEQLRDIAHDTFDDTFRPQNKKENIDAYLKRTFTLDRVKEELVNPNSMFYFLVNDDGNHEDIIGYLKLNINDAQTESMGDDALEIERIYVRKEYHRNGYGQQLFDYAEMKSKLLERNFIWLGVWEKNQQAIEFYHSQGFKNIDAHSFMMGDEEQVDYIMKKSISN